MIDNILNGKTSVDQLMIDDGAKAIIRELIRRCKQLTQLQKLSLSTIKAKAHQNIVKIDDMPKNKVKIGLQLSKTKADLEHIIKQVDSILHE